MQAEPTRTHYQTLGVAVEATAAEIKTAYRRLIREAHPDVAGPDGAARAAELSVAYAILSRPEQREQYDAELRGVGFADHDPGSSADFEDAWGSPDDWQQAPGPSSAADEEETLDDVVIDADPVDPAARADAADGFDWIRSTDDEPVRVRTPIRRLGWLVGVGVILVIATGLWSWLSWSPGGSLTRDQTLTAALVVALFGLGIGYLLHDRVPLNAKSAAIVSAVVIVLGEIVGQPLWQSAVRLLYVFALAVSLGLLLQQLITEQRNLNAVLSAKSLRENNLFGSLSGDVATDLLQRDCDPLYSIPAVRIIRTPAPDALFTHAFVCGNKIAFVRAVVAAGGQFRWSGPTLFRDGADGWPAEVMRGDYEGAARQLPMIMGKTSEVGCWVLVYPPDRSDVSQQPDPLMPAVQDPRAGIDAIGRFLTTANDVSLVDQQRVVTAANTLFG